MACTRLNHPPTPTSQFLQQGMRLSQLFFLPRTSKVAYNSKWLTTLKAARATSTYLQYPNLLKYLRYIPSLSPKSPALTLGFSHYFKAKNTYSSRTPPPSTA
jgi:hypothetical protein